MDGTAKNPPNFRHTNLQRQSQPYICAQYSTNGIELAQPGSLEALGIGSVTVLKMMIMNPSHCRRFRPVLSSTLPHHHRQDRDWANSKAIHLTGVLAESSGQSDGCLESACQTATIMHPIKHPHNPLYNSFRNFLLKFKQNFIFLILSNI